MPCGSSRNVTACLIARSSLSQVTVRYAKRYGALELEIIIHECPLASIAGGGDCYSRGYWVTCLTVDSLMG